MLSFLEFAILNLTASMVSYLPSRYSMYVNLITEAASSFDKVREGKTATSLSIRNG